MKRRLRVGLVGAGPWARSVHAPRLAQHPGIEFTTVWARRPEAARDVAGAHGVSVAESFDDLVAQVDAVSFAVPPSVQAELATRAARAGKHVILEKPIAPDTAAAERLANAVTSAGVAGLVMLTLRFAPETRAWLGELADAGRWTGGSARWLSGALLAGVYSESAWRHEDGALADVGPHAFDLLDAALGPIEKVLAADHTPDDLWNLMFAHAGGATSTATLSLHLPVRPTVVEIAVYGERGFRSLGRKPGAAPECYSALLDDFVAMIETGATSHPCDVHRGLHLQRILDEVRRTAYHG